MNHIERIRNWIDIHRETAWQNEDTLWELRNYEALLDKSASLQAQLAERDAMIEKMAKALKEAQESTWDGYHVMSALINTAAYSDGPAVRAHLKHGYEKACKALDELLTWRKNNEERG